VECVFAYLKGLGHEIALKYFEKIDTCIGLAGTANKKKIFGFKKTKEKPARSVIGHLLAVLLILYFM
jgi:hypothetical protein